MQYIENSSITDCIITYAKSGSVCFVFPSRIASRLWLFQSLKLTGLPALPTEMFSAWDAFKMDCCSAGAENAHPIPQVVRLLFAHYITGKNKHASPPLFSNLIPPDYAEESSIFAQWIAGILPQLDHWEKRTLQHTCTPDAEFTDLSYLKQAYTRFLQENKLFEPSWVGPSFTPHADRYIICYPELMEDFSEYEHLLSERSEVYILPVPAFNANTMPLTEYSTIRGEIRQTLLTIEKLLTEGVPADDIAISIADIEHITPYLQRECRLRNIPLEFRLGFHLGEQQAGRLFKLLEICVQEQYSFKSMKTLLLNPHIPWKNPDIIQAFISFGIENNCLVSWLDDGKYKNVWLEAFKQPLIPRGMPYQQAAAERDVLREWFTGFMKHIEAMIHAESFSAIQKAYFLFREKYLDISCFSALDNAVISRCIAALQALTQLETPFAAYLPEEPYHFFTIQLEKELYVPQNTGTAISVFPFRVAAATPFPHHFVLNCTDNNRVVYQKLPFLRKDKRQKLNITEFDATAAFFAGYTISGRCTFSYSKQTFSGFAVSNGLFEQLVPPPCGDSEDPFLQEYRYLSGEGAAPAALYPIQKHSMHIFSELKQQRGFSFLTEPLPPDTEDAVQCIKQRYYIKDNNLNEYIKVSQTSLKTFSQCPARWFLQSVLHLTEAGTDAELFNPRYIGLITHAVLKTLYEKIRTVDRYFISTHRQQYDEWAQHSFDRLIHTQKDFQGPLAAPFIESLRKRVLESTAFVLNFDEKYLNGFTPLCIEEELNYCDGAVMYHGIIDRLSFNPADGRTLILDYKTGNTISADAYIKPSDPDFKMKDFQIPLYLLLAENAEIPLPNEQKCKLTDSVQHAFFIDLSKQEIKYVVNDKDFINHGYAHAKSRETFEPALSALKGEASRFSQAIAALDFQKPLDISWKNCAECPLHTVCRTTFAVS
ncbi:MAG: PD-(D/E)XK nuclease family protein [Treponema sp.]